MAAFDHADHRPMAGRRNRRGLRLGWCGLLRRIRPVALELGEHLGASLSAVAAMTGACDRLALWAEGGGCPGIDAERNAGMTGLAGGKDGPAPFRPCRASNQPI
ncbi:MAG TPA: hypothetical protein VHA10_25555 [Hypericibacter adhaerens]|uniref:hypothetical protein n=1 Tax=Hypericibacter adhaerens TaxID=2602016 RepID=UPI002C03D969|nr:hypothetical protein [Hypericibacter adhaerens]HWA46610.1 hypothetical protein [Hypericibacter adhaerens]